MWDSFLRKRVQDYSYKVTGTPSISMKSDWFDELHRWEQSWTTRSLNRRSTRRSARKTSPFFWGIDLTLIAIVSKFIHCICTGCHPLFAARGTARASRWKAIFIFSMGKLSTEQYFFKALNLFVHRLMVSMCYRSTSGTVFLPTTLTTTARESSWTGSSTLPAVSAGVPYVEP